MSRKLASIKKWMSANRSAMIGDMSLIEALFCSNVLIWISYQLGRLIFNLMVQVRR